MIVMIVIEYKGYRLFMYFFFFKQKTAYEMRISDWSSDVCSSDLRAVDLQRHGPDVGAALGRGADAGPLPDVGLRRHGAGKLGLGRRCRAGREIGRASCRERVCQYV